MKRKSLLFVLLMALFAPLAMNAQETLTVHDGTSTNRYVPFYGYYADEAQTNQMIYPATELADMDGGEITAMMLYWTNGNYSGGSGVGTWTISIGETSATTLSGIDNTTSLTQVFSGDLDALFNSTDNTLPLTFNNAYTYNGGNLLVQFSHAASSYKDYAFYGETVTGASYCYNSQRNFLPKTTFTYEPAQQSGCAKPRSLAVNYTGGTTAEVSWTSDATAWNIDVNGTVTAITENPYTLTGLNLATTYEVKVQANCGGGELSDWTSAASFTTDACMPEDMCEITLQLTDAYGDGWGGNAINVVDARTSEVLGQYTISSGSSANYTLAICDGRVIEFQWVLGTGYNNGYPDECSWVILDRNGEEITSGEDASAYTTGEVLASYTVDCSVPSCFKPTDLAVSNISNEGAVVTWIAGGENQTAWNLQYKKVSETRWESVNDLREATYTFDRLEDGTVYEVQVQGNCGSEGLSDWTNSMTFTTALCGLADQCEISYELYANYSSNGWTYQGTSYLQIVDTETETVLATLTENSGTGTTEGTLAVCDGRNITFQWIAGGSYESQLVAGFVIYDAAGDVILENEGVLSRPFTYSVVCPTCFKPTNLEATNVGAESAVLNWEGTSASYVLQYRTAEQNINLAEWHQIGDDMTATATETTYTFDLSDYSGAGYVALRHYNVTNMFYLDVDNITVTDPDGATLVSADGTSIPSDWTNQDVDGDGYTWSTSIITGYFVSQSYVNNYGPVYPDNWLIIPVSNLGGTLSFTAKGQDASFPSEIFGVFVTTATLTEALEPVAAGNWSDEITTTNTSYSISHLTANTPYEWHIKGVCAADDETTWATSTFSTIELGAKNFVTEGNWNVADNWEPAGVPTIDDKVIISANATIPAGVVATAKKITLNGGTLTIADGGQLKQNGNVELIMEKEIEAYGTSAGNYYFIASPLTTTRLTFVQDWSYVNALTGNYDLYAFDPTQELEWINYKSNSSHAAFTSGSNNPVLVQQTGYLYANETGITLQFEGSTAVKSNDNVLYEEFSYDDTATDDWNGWALVGNPYTCNAYISYVNASNQVLDADFYTLNTDNTYTLMTSSDALAPCTGAFINYSATGKVQYSTEAPAKSSSMLNMTLNQGRNTVDQARVRFGEGHNLGKMSFRNNNSKLYMPVDGKDFAVVYSEAQGEMPVNFKAEEAGTYTISFNAVNVEFGYLHLIDNMTGADVDLLKNASYTFNANASDYASRFRLVFKATGVNENSESFSFFSNGNLIVNNEGEATVQVIDMLGRIVSSQNINGNANLNLNVNAGVYVIRLINGMNTMTQKIVVE